MAEQQWSEDRLSKLKKLWADGLSISQIGKELDVSRNAVAGKVHRMGLSKRQSPISGELGKKKPDDGKKDLDMMSVENLPLKLAFRRIDWSRSRCSWPSGDPQTTAFSFCGKEVVQDKPYCNEHCFEAYTTVRESSSN